MKVYHLLYLLAQFVCVYANTESFVIRIPHDYPLPVSYENNQHPTISLLGTNHKTQTYNVPLDSTYYIEFQDFQANEDYHVRVCWTAINPVSVTNLGHVIVPHSTSFQGSVDYDNSRIFIHFDVLQNSYPSMDVVSVPVNVSVSNLKLGIPVDLYSTIIYIIVTMSAVYFVNKKYNFYRLLKSTRSQKSL